MLLMAKFEHLNCHKSRGVMAQLARDTESRELDFVSLNEPYVHESSVMGTPGNWTAVHAVGTRFRAALWVSRRISFCAVHRTSDVVAIRCKLSSRRVLVISCYCSPSEDISLVFDQLEGLLSTYQSDDVLLVGDFNAKSTIWGQRPTDPRGRQLIILALNANLEIVNDPDSLPSFSASQGESWIDVLLVRYCKSRITNWEMSDIETLSDHRAMTWTFTGRPASRLPGDAKRRWRPRDLVWDSFLQDLRAADLAHYDFETPEQGVEHLMSILNRLCLKHKRKFQPAVMRTWWTPSLTSQRSKLRALNRRSKDRRLEPARRAHYRALFLRERALYLKAILHAKRASFRRFISEGLIMDKLGQVVEVVRGKWRRDVPEGLVLPTGNRTSSWEDSQDALARHHFLLVDDVSPIAHTRTLDYRPFTIEELELAVSELPSYKVPGHDGIGLEIVRKVLEYHPQWLLSLYCACLKDSIFPRTWKRAVVVYFPKPGKDRSCLDSYRPICLLPTLGKVLDKLCATRLMAFLESERLLDARQFGFRKYMGTADALHSVKTFIAESKQKGEFTCLLTLDIKGAFNNARRTDLLRFLSNTGIDPHLLWLIEAFLWDRSIILYSGEHRYNVGVPQGSCLGPILWLVLINTLLDRFQVVDPKWGIQVFADDTFLKARSPAVYRFGDILAPALETIQDWANELSLTFSYGKCAYTVIPPKGRLAYAPSRVIRMGGRKISFAWQITYLGVVVDAHLSWMPHLDAVQEKSFRILHKLNRLVAASWGIKPKLRKMLYSVVAERILLYASTFWSNGTVKQSVRLQSMQRVLLLCVTKCYRTAPTASLQILSGVLPLDLRAEVDRDFAALTRWCEAVPGSGFDLDEIDRWRPPPNRRIRPRLPWTLCLKPRSEHLYFTDGSRMQNDSVGCAFVLVRGDTILGEAQFRLSDRTEVFAAEVHAIEEAITDGLSRGLSELDVYSDSRSALQALNSLVPKHRAVAEIKDLIENNNIVVHMHWIRAHVGHIYNERADHLAKAATTRPSVDVQVKATLHQVKRSLRERAMRDWQVRWDNEEHGRRTYAIFPAVRTRRLQGDFYINQVFTGHGAFGDHQERFFTADPTCFCEEGVVSTIYHCLYFCPLWGAIREKFFPLNYRHQSVRDLCLDGYSRKGVRLIVEDLLRRTMDRSLGRHRVGRGAWVWRHRTVH